jgi:hypothetical protein
MPYYFRSALFAGLVLAVLLGEVGCSTTAQLSSRWRDREVVVDGKNTEWNAAQTALDDKGTSVGLFNDKEFLYVGLVTTNAYLQNLIGRQGLTFWFDSEAGKDKKFGIHYPVRMRQFGRPSREGEGGDEQAMYARPVGDADNLEICGPGENDRHEMTKAEATGIDVRYRVSKDTLIYELRVPLADNGSYPFAIGTKSGALIGVGVEAGAIPGQRREGGGSSGWGGRRGGGRGEYGGHRGGYRGGSEAGEANSGGRPEPYSAWLKVRLATQDTL